MLGRPSEGCGSRAGGLYDGQGVDWLVATVR